MSVAAFLATLSALSQHRIDVMLLTAVSVVRRFQGERRVTLGTLYRLVASTVLLHVTLDTVNIQLLTLKTCDFSHCKPVTFHNPHEQSMNMSVINRASSNNQG